MSDKNIEIIKHIQATGRCPEDDTIATSSFTESGFQPKVSNKFDIKKSITTSPPAIPTKGSSAVSKKYIIEIRISESDNKEYRR